MEQYIYTIILGFVILMFVAKIAAEYGTFRHKRKLKEIEEAKQRVEARCQSQTK